MDRLFVILNPSAGRGQGAKRKPRIEAALRQSGLTFELVETSHRGQGIALAQAASQAGYPIIVAAGGDGTVSEVINGMACANPAEAVTSKLGLIPIGSGNDFATMLGYTSTVEQSVQRLVSGTTRRCDLGEATILSEGQRQVRYFGNNLGVGFEAEVACESSRIQWLRGSPLYVLAALLTLRRYRSPQVQLRWEAANGVWHEQRKAILLISVGNSPRMGGGFYMTPHAQMDDGLLDLGIANALPWWRILYLLPKVLWGGHVHDPAFSLARARQFQLTAQGDLPVQLDGELVATQVDELTVRLLPGAVEVLV